MNSELFDEFVKYSADRLEGFSIPAQYVEVLSKVGLPAWCAPNIHFGGVGENGAFLPLLSASGKRFLGLGEDRDENPIALDIDDCSVWVLRENGSPAYLARSVLSLTDALRHFQQCVNAAVEIDGGAFLNNRIPGHALDPFIIWAAQQDPQALEAPSFWHDVLVWLNVPDNAFRRTALPDRR